MFHVPQAPQESISPTDQVLYYCKLHNYFKTILMILIKLASGDFRLSIGESFARGFIFQEQIDIQILP